MAEVRPGVVGLLLVGFVVAGGAVGYVALSSVPSHVVPADRPVLHDIWIYNGSSLRPERITTTTAPDRESTAASISGDGRRVVFHSDADFRQEGLPNDTDEIWMYDAASGDLTRLTKASDPGRDSQHPAISDDGSTIVFESDSDLSGEGLPAGQREIWMHDVASGTTTRLTRASAGGTSGGAAVNADGTRVANTHRGTTVFAHSGL